ncbi:MAG: hypothetical protein H6916_06420 [Novosphingobium sp.]|uniref:transferrin-binding protein-like solute binding protein n=1 Tax=Novosphingobium sp. TaxID=1874826 RepID=UPI0026176C27|nr:transferrin-binding protein-like solute binding protein [Novosphingobium sp.]MCP5386437.1 hypothetical protein [Novosphingobium sp.]
MTVTYDVAAGSYVINAPGGITGIFELSNADPAHSTATTQAFKKTTSTGQQELRVTWPTVGGVPLSYTMFGRFINVAGSDAKAWLAVGGMPTIASDMPKTGTATYSAETAGSIVSGGVQYDTTTASTATFSANFGTGAISTSLHLIAAPVGSSAATDFGTFNGTGAIAAGSSAFSGTFAGTTGPGFVGSFFGPQGAEMGYVYNFLSGSNEAFGGTSGKKQ